MVGWSSPADSLGGRRPHRPAAVTVVRNRGTSCPGVPAGRRQPTCKASAGSGFSRRKGVRPGQRPAARVPVAVLPGTATRIPVWAEGASDGAGAPVAWSRSSSRAGRREPQNHVGASRMSLLPASDSHLRDWVLQGESETQEFKTRTSSGCLREGTETLCGMLNTRGGRVLYGIDPAGVIVG